MDKKTVKEIVFIFIAASALGILYNALSDKSIPLVRKPAKKEAVSDSVLFGEKTASTDYLEKTVVYEQIVKLIGKPDVLFIDARSPEQYAKGRIDGAINIFPLAEDKGEYLDKINSLPKDKILIVYCDGGECDLSSHLARDLHSFGYDQTFLYAGGWADWTARQKGEKRESD